ncbi:unnamed protein product [Meganyctiphanes norvegica]|uniref:Uncharacterized protein n=1 Tax=Meganyctiphanes norvegica TaxID=48144 RepID=A0AAV2R832_MEGNR
MLKESFELSLIFEQRNNSIGFIMDSVRMQDAHQAKDSRHSQQRRGKVFASTTMDEKDPCSFHGHLVKALAAPSEEKDSRHSQQRRPKLANAGTPLNCWRQHAQQCKKAHQNFLQLSLINIWNSGPV